jgi:hypothetical protein
MLTAFYIRVLNPEKVGFQESDELRVILEKIALEFDCLLKDASDYHALGKISEQVMQAIDSADVVFADANSPNENVWYEIGYADRTNAKKVVCLYKKGRSLPFDRTDMRSVQYDASAVGLDTLGQQLAKMMIDLLCDKRLRELLPHAEGPKAASQYLSSNKLRRFGVEWLASRVRNSHDDIDLRIASLQALGILSALTADILLELFDRLGPLRMRVAAYEQVKSLDGLLPDNVWNYLPEFDNETGLRDAYAFALVNRWLADQLHESRIRELLANHPNLRTSFILAVQRSFESPQPTIVPSPVFEGGDPTPDIPGRIDRRHF